MYSSGVARLSGMDVNTALNSSMHDAHRNIVVYNEKRNPSNGNGTNEFVIRINK